MDADWVLIQKLRNGDEKAADVFVHKYYPCILNYCLMRGIDRGSAEDLTQDTFVRFFSSLDQYRHYGKTMNYLYVIARNACRNHFKKKAEIPVEQLPAESYTEKYELKVDIQRAVDSLPTDLREIALLYYVQDVGQRDIAHILNISLSLVKYRVRQTRKLLASKLNEENEQ